MAWAKVGPFKSRAACIAAGLNAAVASRTKGHMIPELGTSARGRLDAGVRRHANDDHLLDAALLEVEVESCTDRRAASRSGSRYSRQTPKVLSLAFCPGIMGRAGAVAVVKRLDLCHVNETDRRFRAWVRGGSAAGNLPEPQPASVPWCFPVRPDLVPCSAELIPCSAT